MNELVNKENLPLITTEEAPPRIFGETLISVENVSKCYRIWTSPQARLQHPMMNAMGAMFPFSKVGLKNPKHRAKDLFREFYALDNVSLEARRGETIGLIGRNGAGKSTLLQIICGTLQPTSGSVFTKGRVAALLELGSGFNPDFTGRENVWMNGAILGMSKEEISERMDSIEEFADVGDFIEQPVKTYSSGMTMRLAFAVATCSNPDVLIVDEALSVGDVFFGQKCMRRIRHLKDTGTTLLFVSHDANLVQNLCEKTLFLQKGKTRYYGDSKQVARIYFQESGFKWRDQSPTFATAGSHYGKVDPMWLDKAVYITKKGEGAIEGVVQMIGVRIQNEDGLDTTSIAAREPFSVEIAFYPFRSGAYNPSLTLTNRYGQIVTTASPYIKGHEIVAAECDVTFIVRFTMEALVEPGNYTLKAAVSTDDPLSPDGRAIVESEDIGPLQVVWDYDSDKPPFVGLFDLPYEIKVDFWRGLE